MSRKKWTVARLPRVCQILVVAAFVLLVVQPGVGSELFEWDKYRLSRKELGEVFQVKSHEEVPPFQVISIPHVLKKRSPHLDDVYTVSINAFGEKVYLQLVENRHLIKPAAFETFLADEDPVAGVRYDRVDPIDPAREASGDDEVIRVFQDVRNNAAISMYTDNRTDGVLLDGTFGRDFVVKPVPESLLRGDSANATEGLQHVVFKKPYSWFNNSDYDFMESSGGGGGVESQLSYNNLLKSYNVRRIKRQAPAIIYPEILVIVDYDGYRLHGEDNVAIKRYVISFWNGVDLRYKQLKGPIVKINIAGIIIARGRKATPYLEKNRVGSDAIDSASALTAMGKYLFVERRLPVYDIAVAITKLDMCRRKSRGGPCNRGTAGFAYVGGACVVNKRLEKVNSVAIVEDTGGFSGIIVAAHELGHLLGAVHDGSPPPSYLGGPGARKCRWEDGFIMSDLRHTSKGFEWSSCTVSQFRHFLNGETATCMYNSPHEDETLPRVLPGRLLSLDAQCRKDRGTSACFKDGRVCAQLFCFDAKSGYCVSYRPAAEGSRCGQSHVCLNGHCVTHHENSLDF